MFGWPRPSPSRETARFRPNSVRTPVVFVVSWTLLGGHPRSSDLFGGSSTNPQSRGSDLATPEVGFSKIKGAILSERCPSVALSSHEREFPLRLHVRIGACPMSCGHGAHSCAMAPGQRGVQRQSSSVSHPPLIKCDHGMQGQGQHTMCKSTQWPTRSGHMGLIIPVGTSSRKLHSLHITSLCSASSLTLINYPAFVLVFIPVPAHILFFASSSFLHTSPYPLQGLFYTTRRHHEVLTTRHRRRTGRHHRLCGPRGRDRREGDANRLPVR